MDMNEYQDLAKATAVYPRNENFGIIYTALGLASEAGEYAGKVKKMLRDNVWSRSDAAAELGDVLWYVAAAAGDLGMSLDDIAQANIAKLTNRKARNVIAGDGDNR